MIFSACSLHLTLDNPDIREEELDVSDEVPEIKSKLSFKEETEAEVITRGHQQSRHGRVADAQVTICKVINLLWPLFKATRVHYMLTDKCIVHFYYSVNGNYLS